MAEKWRDIKGFEGHYVISNYGNVVSLKNGKRKLMKLSIESQGYYRVTLSNKNQRKYIRVHRLVAEHFIDNVENKSFVNHIDGNKLNNYHKNLEWCTHKENCKHAKNIGLMSVGEKHGRSKLNAKQVSEIICLKGIKTQKQISEEYSISINHVKNIMNKRYWKHIKLEVE